MVKRDSGYDRPAGSSEASANRHGGKQAPGGDSDNTPGQVGKSNVSAEVLMANPSRLDSMGGSENRGKGNKKE